MHSPKCSLFGEIVFRERIEYVHKKKIAFIYEEMIPFGRCRAAWQVICKVLGKFTQRNRKWMGPNEYLLSSARKWKEGLAGRVHLYTIGQDSELWKHQSKEAAHRWMNPFLNDAYYWGYQVTAADLMEGKLILFSRIDKCLKFFKIRTDEKSWYLNYIIQSIFFVLHYFQTLYKLTIYTKRIL